MAHAQIDTAYFRFIFLDELPLHLELFTKLAMKLKCKL